MRHLNRNTLSGLLMLCVALLPSYAASAGPSVETNRVVEIKLQSSKTYENPFIQIELDAIVTRPDVGAVRPAIIRPLSAR